MNVAFYSNFLNHHQLPFCLAMERLTKGNFTFVATTPVPQDRLDMGYKDMNKQYPFVLTTYDSKENAKKAEELALSCDFIVTGSAPEKYTRMRIKQNKLTFRYSERIYKRGKWTAIHPRKISSMLLQHLRYKKCPLYMLCASAYTAADFATFGAYKGKTYKWGYFPEVKVYDIDDLMARKQQKGKVSILWVGRLMKLKHPEVCIALAERLKNAGYEFELNIIGSGQLENHLKSAISHRGIDDCVHMLGVMPPEKVREHMEAADIFLFTSNFREGWGAVINESMNSACAVVASHAIGSVPFLIKSGETGFIYKYKSIQSLYSCVVQLIEKPELRIAMGREAYKTMYEVWNADVAAERLIEIAENILSGKGQCLYKYGPCSEAEVLSNGWIN